MAPQKTSRLAWVLFLAACDFAPIGTKRPSKPPEPPELFPALCEMLGMAGEYNGRDYGDPDIEWVESFYPHEECLARHYEALVSQYNGQSGNRFEVSRHVGDQGHITLSSRALGAVIAACYEDGTMDPGLIVGASLECRLRYVSGAHQRFGRKINLIDMANAPFKIQTIAEVLRSLDCSTVLTGVDRGTTPTGFYVFFEPSPQLETRIEIRRHFTEIEVYNAAVHTRWQNRPEAEMCPPAWQ